MLPLLIFAGAGLGGVLRFYVGGWIQSSAGAAFPWGTLAVNISGSALLAFALPFLQQYLPAAEWRAFIAVGLFGGYTTFSTFSYESISLVQEGAWLRAATYVLASVVPCLLGAVLGLRAAGFVLPRS